MEWTNSQGVKYYLTYKDLIWGRNKLPKRNYFFTKKVPEISCTVPVGYKVSETHTGMPVLKKL